MDKVIYSYQKAGVDYRVLDAWKITAQKEGAKTACNLPVNFREVNKSRGESAYIVKRGNFYLVATSEGLGTKNLIADEMSRLTGREYYHKIAQDTVAMIVNDIITVGAKPLVVNAYWAAGRSAFFANRKRMRALVTGWKKACDLSGCAWGGGETPVLKGIIKENAIDLAGSSLGIIESKKNLILGEKLQSGDKIILLPSSGIHANGLTLARKIASKLPQGFLTKMANNKILGEALLTPTVIYAKVIEDLLKSNIALHYLVHITGHGWRKLIRYKKNFTCQMESLPPVPPEIVFLIQKGNIGLKEAYATFNMGAGFALFVSGRDAKKAQAICQKHRLKAIIAGRVLKGKRELKILPLKLTYNASDLVIRTK